MGGRYTCKTVSTRAAKQDLSEGIGGIAPIENAVGSLASSQPTLTLPSQVYNDSNMKRIYTMSFRKGGALLAAAGHGGYAGIFGVGGLHFSHLHVQALTCRLSRTGKECGDSSLISWRAHSGWIGEIQAHSAPERNCLMVLQFLSYQQEDQNLLLTASNDKAVSSELLRYLPMVHLDHRLGSQPLSFIWQANVTQAG